MEVASLPVERARKFLHALADDAFLCIVVTDDEGVRIFSKGIEDEHLERIKAVLRKIQEG
jgi:hypothetical protein